MLSVTGSMERRPDSPLFRGLVKRATAGERTLAIPPTLLAALRVHMHCQAVERTKAGRRWQDHSFAFCTDVGAPLDPSNLRKVFARVARKAGMAPTAAQTQKVRNHEGRPPSLWAIRRRVGARRRTAAGSRLLGRHCRHRVRPEIAYVTRSHTPPFSAPSDRPPATAKVLVNWVEARRIELPNLLHAM